MEAFSFPLLTLLQKERTKVRGREGISRKKNVVYITYSFFIITKGIVTMRDIKDQRSLVWQP